MTPSPYQIFCIGIIWFIYTIMTFFRFLRIRIKGFIHSIYLSYISLLYNSEKDYFSHINKSKSVKYPINLALVLNNFLITEQMIISALCQFIRWIILTNKIKYLTIYDPFNIINIINLIEEISENLNNNQYIESNINIHISYKESKNEKLVEKNLEIKKSKNVGFECNIYICIIGFKEANVNLVNKIVKEKKSKIYGNYPEVYKWFNDKKSNKEKMFSHLKHFCRFTRRQKNIIWLRRCMSERLALLRMSKKL